MTGLLSAKRLWPDQNSADQDREVRINTETEILMGKIDISKFRRQNGSYDKDHETTF
jgi:hypothetical protein